MKKAKQESQHDILPEYDFRKGARGKYVKRYAEGTNIVVLAPDMAKVFRTSESVNKALRTLVRGGENGQPNRIPSASTYVLSAALSMQCY
ncbi:hypothetical protein W02_37450 [Nitrospira sp. KM1]|uniref:hypothetical protein n=1 Tax=Nitrospira sp. KM1 TaxID=1936990 RepID=UPI0013A76D15|nr:hypothetical protein [Nitrospira sp. KM1]BCA56605.1 hypothetical protein W02_37450 [Nitrospira sp. KM1]